VLWPLIGETRVGPGGNASNGVQDKAFAAILLRLKQFPKPIVLKCLNMVEFPVCVNSTCAVPKVLWPWPVIVAIPVAPPLTRSAIAIAYCRIGVGRIIMDIHPSVCDLFHARSQSSFDFNETLRLRAVKTSLQGGPKKNPKCSTYNFVKYWPILKILSPLQSPENLQCSGH